MGTEKQKNMYKTHTNKNVVSDFIRKLHPNKHKKNVTYLLPLKKSNVYRKRINTTKYSKKDCILITKI